MDAIVLSEILAHIYKRVSEGIYLATIFLC